MDNCNPYEESQPSNQGNDTLRARTTSDHIDSDITDMQWESHDSGKQSTRTILLQQMTDDVTSTFHPGCGRLQRRLPHVSNRIVMTL
jgi:hypothetical protein